MGICYGFGKCNMLHIIVSWDFFTLELGHDTYRDPLIPPPEVWNEQNKHYVEEVKIRNERFY